MTIPCPNCQAPIESDSRFCGACGLATSGTQPGPTPAVSPELVGREIAGRYRIQSKLGEGGMGAVFKAEQISLKRQVAVKLLKPDVSNVDTLLRRFNAEAELVAKLSHPNTVNIYDFGQDTDGTLFIAMEFIEGRSLRTVIHEEAPLPLRRALQIASQIAASLSDAHARKIIHRDLKPDNVMLQERGRTKDVVRVLDFGIAKLRDEGRATQAAMTQAGDMLGTPQYMAPEQIRAEQIDGRTDVYALGCIIYEMITARLPYEGPTIMSLLSKHLTENAPPPSVRRNELGIPPMIDELVMIAMAKDPAHRPPTMEAYGERIAAALEMLPRDSGSPSAVVPVGNPSAGWAPPPPPTGPAQYYGGTGPQPLMHTPTPGPPMHVPTPGGQMPNGFAAPTPPPMQTPYVPPQQTSAPKKSNAALWVVLILLVLGGAGAGVYFGVIKKKASSTEPQKDPVVDPNKPHPDVEFDDDGSGDDDGEPIDIKIPDIQIPAPGSGDVKDIWGDQGAGGGGGGTPSPSDGHLEEVVSGVKLNVPTGFTVSRPEGRFVAAGMGILVVGVSIQAAITDENQLIKLYAQGEKMKLLRTQRMEFAGEERSVGFMRGNAMGTNVEVYEIVTTLMGPGYKVAIILAVPTALADANPDMIDKALGELSSRIVLPGS